MSIILCSDEYYNNHQYIFAWLKENNLAYEKFGALESKADEPWINVIKATAKIVSSGKHEGIFFCWSGTGASIVANKVAGIRAALCFDGESAKLARIWNKANILVIPNRILNPILIDEILTAWFTPYKILITEEELQCIDNYDSN